MAANDPEPRQPLGMILLHHYWWCHTHGDVRELVGAAVVGDGVQARAGDVYAPEYQMCTHVALVSSDGKNTS